MVRTLRSLLSFFLFISLLLFVSISFHYLLLLQLFFLFVFLIIIFPLLVSDVRVGRLCWVEQEPDVLAAGR